MIRIIKKLNLKKFFENINSSSVLMLYWGGALIIFAVFFYQVFFTQDKPSMYQLLTGVYMLMFAHYQNRYLEQTKENKKLLQENIKQEISLKKEAYVTNLILERASLVPPEVLQEAGMSIRKNTNVKGNVV